MPSILALILLVAPPPSRGEPVTLARTEVVPIDSRAGLHYQLSVSLPRSYAASGAQYPVIYLLDPDYSFAIVRNVVEHLSDRGGFPEVIIVGVGYPEGLEGPDWKRRYRLQRTRDYTPTASPKGYPDGVQDVSGAGPAFLAFLETELVPAVEQRYRALPERVLVGHSYGGLFALYAALSRPRVFSRVVSVSPSIWYDDQWVLGFQAAQRPKLKEGSGRVFLAAGANETGKEHGDITGNVRRLAVALAGWRGLEVKGELFDQEDHDTVFPVAVTRGLRWIFGAAPSPPGE